jgi:hypothetical protein
MQYWRRSKGNDGVFGVHQLIRSAVSGVFVTKNFECQHDCRPTKYKYYPESRSQSKIYFRFSSGHIEIKRRSCNKSDEVAQGFAESGIIVKIRRRRRWNFGDTSSQQWAISISGLQVSHFYFRLFVDIKQHRCMLHWVRWSQKYGCSRWNFGDTTCLTWLTAVTSFNTFGAQGVSGFPLCAWGGGKTKYMLNPPKGLKLYA